MKMLIQIKDHNETLNMGVVIRNVQVKMKEQILSKERPMGKQKKMRLAVGLNQSVSSQGQLIINHT